MRRTRKTVPFNIIKVEEDLRGRDNQHTDKSHVAFLKSLLDSGIPFRDPIVITKDGYLTGGNHRHDAYSQYFESKGTLDTATVDVVELDILWSATPEEDRRDIILLALGDNAGNDTKPIYVKDIQYAITPYLEDTKDDDIVRRFGKFFNPKLVRKALKIAKDAAKQRVRAHIVADKEAGDSIPTLNRRYGTALVTEALTHATKPYHDRLRYNKIKKDAQIVAGRWGKKYGEVKDFFLAGSIAQGQFTEAADTMDAAALKLTKKAASIRKSIQKDIVTFSQRVRVSKPYSESVN